MTANRFLAAALAYAKRGYFVLPLEERAKRPLSPQGYKDATLDRDIITAWWRRWPRANIGIAVGRDYDLVVIDVDGPDGADELARLEREYGPLGITREASSGRAHRKHLYYRFPDGADALIRRVIKLNGTALDILVDGYVVAPPSIHPKTGKPYRWTRKVKPLPLPPALQRVAAAIEATPAARASAALPDVIPEGSRDAMLTSLAGTMRRRGCGEESILAALLEENARRCDPPLPESQVRKIARSVVRYGAVPFVFTEAITDSSLADRFAQIEEGGLRYCPEWKRWLVWDGRHWAPDVTLEAQRRVEAMVQALFEHLPQLTDATERERFCKVLNRYSRHRQLEDVLARARSNRRLVITPDRLDRDPWLFNVRNGVIDLRSGAIRAHDPKDLITKLAPVTYDSHARAPQWERFLTDIMRSDQQLITFLQYAVGYTMVGEVREHVLFFCYGGGANGKSTFLEVLHALFGDYAITIDFETLLHQRNQSSEARRDLPRLHQARLVTANETPTDARWDERTIKWLTGGDTLAGRKLYQEKFEFTPTHTLWCRANDQPTVRDLSEGFWRRLRQIPFNRQFADREQVKDLKARLLRELPGILNWALAGAVAWQKAGALPEAARVEKATASYRKEEDVYGQFLEAACVRADAAWTETAELYDRFKIWWTETHGTRSAVPSLKAFGKGLSKQRGIESTRRRIRSSKVRGWTGIRLK